MLTRLMMGVVLTFPVLLGAGCGRSAPPAPPAPVVENQGADASRTPEPAAPVDAAAGETRAVLLHVPDMTEKLKLV